MIPRLRPLVLATFLAMSAGFAGGYWLAGQDSGPASEGVAPHEVGPQELIQLGMQSLAAGDFAAAERRFRAAAEQQPEDPAPHTDLAVALIYQERWVEAAAALATARRLDPALPEIPFLEGLLQRDGFGDLPAARAAWERFLTLVPAETPQAVMVREWLATLEGTGAGAVPETGAALDAATGTR